MSIMTQETLVRKVNRREVKFPASATKKDIVEAIGAEDERGIIVVWQKDDITSSFPLSARSSEAPMDLTHVVRFIVVGRSQTGG